MANVAPDVIGARQGWTPFQVPVGLDSKRGNAGLATAPRVALFGAIAKRLCQRTEIPDIVAGKERDAIRVELLALDRRQQRKEIEKMIWLKHQRGPIRRAAHRRGQ